MKFDNNVPIYFQIIENIKKRVVNNEYIEGQRIPSVRTLCAEYEVTSLTIQRVIFELENENIIYTKKGIGSFLNEGIYLKLKNELSKNIIDKYISNMKSIGYKNKEILKFVEEELKKFQLKT